MAKQIHVRLEDSLFETLSDYLNENELSANDYITGLIMQSLSNQLVASLFCRGVGKVTRSCACRRG